MSAPRSTTTLSHGILELKLLRRRQPSLRLENYGEPLEEAKKVKVEEKSMKEKDNTKVVRYDFGGFNVLKMGMSDVLSASQCRSRGMKKIKW